MAQFYDKSLKFLKFVLRQAARAALGLESLQAPSGRQIREFRQRATKLARGRGGICNDFLALEEFLQRFAPRPAAPAFDDLGGDLGGLLAQVVEQVTQQARTCQGSRTRQSGAAGDREAAALPGHRG